MEKASLDTLNATYAEATAQFLSTTQAGRDHYRLTVDRAQQAEARWLADPDNERLEAEAAAAHADLVRERADLVKSIGAAKAARTKTLDAAWAEVTKLVKK